MRLRVRVLKKLLCMRVLVRAEHSAISASVWKGLASEPRLRAHQSTLNLARVRAAACSAASTRWAAAAWPVFFLSTWLLVCACHCFVSCSALIWAF